MREPTDMAVAEQVNSPAVPTIATPVMVAAMLTTFTEVIFKSRHAVAHVTEQLPAQGAVLLSTK
jgi:hypothetical protein